MSTVRKLLRDAHAVLTADRHVMRAVWYSSAGTLAWMEVTDGHHLYGVLVGILSLHYENMPGGE